jgi:predicted phosphoribosyltransferase
MVFANRTEAGRRLAPLLDKYRDEHPVVLGLARGGVPVGYEVAQFLSAPLDVMVVRKLGAPWQPELAIGAVAPGVRFLNQSLIDLLMVSHQELETIIERENRELERRLEEYRGDRPQVDLAGRTAILVDDGIATGATILASAESVRQYRVRRIVIATPVCASDTMGKMRQHVDDVVCVEAVDDFGAVGYWYDDFSQTSDDEVIMLLRRAVREIGAAQSHKAVRQ